jgi:hypothetical protein
MKKKLTQFFILSSSVLALAAINYTIIHNPFIFFVIFVMLIHELGHYFAALYNDGDPDIPYFIPIPFFPIGITRIRKMKFLSFNSKKNIIVSGPLFGALSAFILYLFSLSLNSVYTLPLLFLSFTELIFGFIGFDGKKYRQYSRQEKLSCI